MSSMWTVLLVLLVVQLNFAWGKKCKGKSSVTDGELVEFSEAAFGREPGTAATMVTVRLQAVTRSDDDEDLSPLPLLEVSPAVEKLPTVARLVAMYDNYHPNTATKEQETPEELREQSEFLDAVLDTPIWNYTRDFFVSKGLLNGSRAEMKDLLATMWFTNYSRGKNKFGSSGFEHVFVGEIRGGKAMGMHNWIYFSREEQNNNTNYLGYMRYVDFGGKGGFIRNHFTWLGKPKGTGSMTVGTSPELDLALYTACFLARPGCVCRLRLGGRRVAVQTYVIDAEGRRAVGSAFPLV